MDLDLSGIARLVGALALIVGLMYLLVYLLRRFLPGAARASAERVDLYLISQMAVGTRQKIAIVRVQDRTLVVGIGEDSITLLTELSVTRQKAAEKEPDDPKIFADMLSWTKDGGSTEPAPGPSRQP